MPDGSLQAPWQGLPTITYVGANATRWDFDFELGHQFDWTVLTPADRAVLTPLFEQWGGRLPWWNSEEALDDHSEDGLEGLFAGDYADCAEGISDGPRMCSLIDRFGGRPVADSWEDSRTRRRQS